MPRRFIRLNPPPKIWLRLASAPKTIPKKS
nr:MAG TPA_asm: hypothetical protein [Caudoviricetes sp.]